MNFKKLLFITAILVSIQFASNTKAQAQTDYTTGVGLFLDLGNGGTYVGPHAKHYFTDEHAGQAMVLFGNDIVIIGAEYSYNKDIPGAAGLKWNVGIGPQLAFGNDETDFLLRPQVGLEFKIPNVPIGVGFDWRPWWILTSGSDFEGARFGLAFKYTLD